ncbi:MAG: efflux RND transporter periplasmic adaptor subunit [Puniceicoccaceae bacterium]|nr:MAG: efflux RND transporter periplasmic adaptor subunit [Puniceicoccaceae bacterium]
MIARLILLSSGLFVAATLAGCGRGVDVPGAGAGAGGGGMPPRPVEVAEVRRQPMEQRLSLVGTLEANESVVLRSEYPGVVASIEFRDGQAVRRGDVLVRMDDRDARAQLAEAQSRQELARLVFERNQTLFESRTLPETDLDRSRADLLRAQADVERLAVRVEKAEVVAPFDGIAGARLISPGDLLTTGTEITRIDDVSQLKVDFAVPERFSDLLAEDSLVLVRRGEERERATATTAEGKVYFISSSVDRATRATQVKAVLPEPPSGFRPGMFVEVELVLRREEDALVVPETAVLSRADGTYLLRVDASSSPATIAFEPIAIGIRRDGLVQIIPRNSSLGAGASVVAAGVGALPLFPGAEVNPRPLTFTGGT